MIVPEMENLGAGACSEVDARHVRSSDCYILTGGVENHSGLTRGNGVGAVGKAGEHVVAGSIGGSRSRGGTRQSDRGARVPGDFPRCCR